MKRSWTLAVLLLATCIAPAARAVDGVVEINRDAVQAGGITPGDTPGFPATLSRSGSYRLTGDLLSNSRATPLVDITADRVSLDLNGFTVGACVSGLSCGIGTAALVDAFGGTDVRVHGGLVTGAGGTCVRITGRGDVRDLQVVGCERGISVGPDSRVADVTVADSAGVGITLGRASVLRDSVVTGSGESAVRVSFNALVLDTVIRGNEGAFSASGVGVFTAGGYRGCVITENDGVNEVQPINGLMRSLGQNVCGSDSSCP